MQAVGLGSLHACNPAALLCPPPACSQHGMLTSALHKSLCGVTGKKEKQPKTVETGQIFLQCLHPAWTMQGGWRDHCFAGH